MAEVGMEPQSMSADELKAKLYQQFRQKGVVDSLKSQLRTRLVNELRDSYTSRKPEPSPSKRETEGDAEGSLMQRAANSLVADHLRRCKYEYSLAVFLPESETGKDKMFTIRELLGLLGVHAESQLFRRVTENLRGYHPKGLLWQLLCDLTSSCGRSHEVGVQVESGPPSNASIEKKLTAVDELFDHGLLGRPESTNQTLQGQLLSLQRKMEARTKEEITREICRFKESEGKRIELEEREKCRKEISKARREMESTYQAKVESLTERERSTVERIQRHQEMVERETYSQRQSLLEELQTLKQKESELKREAELNKRAMSNEENRRKGIEENLKMREGSLARMEESYEKRYKDHIRQYEIEQQDKLSKRLKDIEERESRLRESQSQLENEKELLTDVREEVKERKSRINELELLYQQSRYDSVAVNKRNEVLAERLKDMMDYHSIKEDNAVMRQELHNEKRRLAEVLNEQKIERARHEEALTSMAEKISQPSAQTVTLHGELQRTKCQLEQERNLLQHKEAQHRASLQNEREHNKELRRQLEDQSTQMREMAKEMSDLRQTLRQTQQALSNEVYRRSAKAQRSPARSPGGPLEFPEHDTLEPLDHYIDTSLHQMNIEQQLLLADESIYRGVSADDEQSELSPNATLAFLDHTKARFQQLEREAESLEQNYHNFQYRMIDVPDAPRSPPQRYGMDVSPSSAQVSRRDAAIRHPPMQQPLFDDGAAVEASGQQGVGGTVPSSRRGVHASEGESVRPSNEQATDRQLGRMFTKTEEIQLPQSPVDTVASLFHSSSKMSQHEPKLEQLSPAPHDNSAPVPEPLSDMSTGPSQGLSDGGARKEGNALSRPEREELRVQQEDVDKREEAMRLRHEEEERENREWEEKRQQREEERRLRDQEAREREEAMLRALQKQESGQVSTTEERVNPVEEKTASDREEETVSAEQTGQAQSEEEPLKIDPVMERYMQMVQSKKNHTPAETKPSSAASHSDVRQSSPNEIDDEGGALSSTGHVSDNSDDPFDDW